MFYCSYLLRKEVLLGTMYVYTCNDTQTIIVALQRDIEYFASFDTVGVAEMFLTVHSSTI